MDRKVFFDLVRPSLFSGHLIPGQVQGIESILDAWDNTAHKGPTADPRWLAYILATAYHETSQAMVPVRETGLGKGHAYATLDPITMRSYYGRGQAQLTWRVNYLKMGAKLGVDLLHNPDLMLEPAISAAAIVRGMSDGDFTGKALSDFFYRAHSDPVQARRIINGLDRAELVAEYYLHFLAALHAAIDWRLA